jgi:transcriptional/translational regulatory protein YebC/TACO1
MKTDGDNYEIYTAPLDIEKVKAGLIAKGITPSGAVAEHIPDNLVTVSAADAPGVLKLMELLEAVDDVKDVFANFDIPDAVMEKIAA